MEKIICLICTYSLNSIYNVYLILVYRFLWWLWCWSDIRNVILNTLNAVLKSVTHFLSHIKISHYVCTHCYCFYTALLKIFSSLCWCISHPSLITHENSLCFCQSELQTLNYLYTLPYCITVFSQFTFFFLICIK